MKKPGRKPFTGIPLRRLAVIEAVLVTAIWSSSFVIVKLGLEELGPLTIAGSRYFLGSLVLLPFFLLKRGPRKPISKNLWLRLALLGISSHTIGNGALFWGLKYIPATTGSLLMNLIPLLVLAGSVVWLKENPNRWQLLGVLVSLGGGALFFGGELQPGEPRGLAIVAAGLVGFMAFSLLGRGIARERELDTLRLTTLPLLIGGLASLLVAWGVEGLPHFSVSALLVVLWLALINTALGYMIYNHALRELTALEMNVFMNLTPLFTAVISWIVLGEKLVSRQIIGMLLVIVGVTLVQTLASPKGSQPPEAGEISL
jgi:drug/metabolite transporter (DMT)-like permease